MNNTSAETAINHGAGRMPISIEAIVLVQTRHS